MVKTRRATQEQAREEEEEAFAHGYPTRARESALGSSSRDPFCGKVGGSAYSLDMKFEADSPLETLLKITRDAATKQLARIQEIETALRPPQSLIPVPGLSDADQLFHCQICSHAFDHSTHQPLCLPCGHTICRECTKMIRNSNVRGLCPFDRRDFTPVIDVLPVHSSVADMLDGRMQRAKQVCCEHYRPYVGLCLTTQKLVCGVCLINTTDPLCFPFGTDEVERARSGVLERLASLKQKAENYLMLWNHSYELLTLYSEDPRDLYGSIYTQKTLAKLLDDISYSVEDIKDLAETIIAYVEERLSQLVAVEHAWESLTVAEQLSVQLDDVYKAEDLTEILTLTEQLLSIPMCVRLKPLSISSSASVASLPAVLSRVHSFVMRIFGGRLHSCAIVKKYCEKERLKVVEKLQCAGLCLQLVRQLSVTQLAKTWQVLAITHAE